MSQISPEQRKKLKAVTEKFSFCANDYYLSLINWDDPDDPLRRVIIPSLEELEEWGNLDPSDEEAYTVMPGLEHKYHSTVLMIVSNKCECICRYCFRKRVFFRRDRKCLENLQNMLTYIRNHQEITNVLLTGGDPLSLPTQDIEDVVRQLREIEHVQIIRIGTKAPVFNPHRIIDDTELIEMLTKYNTANKKIYIMTHFSYPRELTYTAAKALTLLQKTGAMLTNQCPLIRGINDNPEVLAELYKKASSVGVVPYYLFQCRPALGNRAYTVPIEEGYMIFEQAKGLLSGLAKRVRYVMSHSTGKIEIVGMTDENIYLKYHRAFRDEDTGRFLAFKRNPEACWLDDYDQPIEDSSVIEDFMSI